MDSDLEVLKVGMVDWYIFLYYMLMVVIIYEVSVIVGGNFLMGVCNLYL